MYFTNLGSCGLLLTDFKKPPLTQAPLCFGKLFSITPFDEALSSLVSKNGTEGKGFARI